MRPKIFKNVGYRDNVNIITGAVIKMRLTAIVCLTGRCHQEAALTLKRHCQKSQARLILIVFFSFQR